MCSDRCQCCRLLRPLLTFRVAFTFAAEAPIKRSSCWIIPPFTILLTSSAFSLLSTLMPSRISNFTKEVTLQSTEVVWGRYYRYTVKLEIVMSSKALQHWACWPRAFLWRDL